MINHGAEYTNKYSKKCYHERFSRMSKYTEISVSRQNKKYEGILLLLLSFLHPDSRSRFKIFDDTWLGASQ